MNGLLAPEAEEAICAVLIVPDTAEILVDALRRLAPDHFRSKHTRLIYRAIRAVAQRSEVPNKANVAEELRSQGKLEEVGGPEALRYDPSVWCDQITGSGYIDVIVEAQRKRELYGLGRDTADAAKNGKPSAEIIEEARSTLERIDAKSNDDRLVWTPQSVYFLHGVPETKYDVEPIILRDGGPVFVIGDPGSGKTQFAIHLTAAILTGGKACGRFKTTPRPRGLFINLDGGASDFGRRAAMLGCEVPEFLIASPEEFGIDRLRRVVEGNPGSWIVIDCFSDIYRPDPNAEQGADMRAFLRPLRALFEKHDCNGLLLDHTNRSSLTASQRFYGSVQKKASIRQMISVDRITANDRPDRMRIKVECAKMSEAAPFTSFLVDFVWSDKVFGAEFAGEVDETTARASQMSDDAEIVESVLAKAGRQGMKATEIAAESKLSRERVRKALTIAVVDAVGAVRSPNRRYYRRAPVVALDFENEE